MIREQTFRVSWEIDIDATSPLAAAEIADGILRDPHPDTAWVYTVRHRDRKSVAVTVTNGKGEKT